MKNKPPSYNDALDQFLDEQQIRESEANMADLKEQVVINIAKAEALARQGKSADEITAAILQGLLGEKQ
jgi:hypothetical protein